MFTTISNREEAHYYDHQGNPRHGATMKQVREEGLLISVTTDLKILAKPALSKWREKKLLKAFFDFIQRFGHAPFEEAMDGAYRLFEEENKAAEIGTAVHLMIEDAFLNALSPGVFKEYYLTHVDPIAAHVADSAYMAYKWAYQNIKMPKVEEMVIDIEAGYGGKADLLGVYQEKKALVDWKTQLVKNPGMGKRGLPLKPKVNKYPEWVMQLGAYSKPKEVEVAFIGVIGTTEGFPFFLPIEYQKEDLVEGYKAYRYVQKVSHYLKKIP